ELLARPEQRAHLLRWASGTKLGRIRPCANRSEIQSESLTSLLRPGTFLMCAAFASTSLKSSSDNMCQTGFQYTPVASIATCAHLVSVSHSDSAIRLAVVVANVRISLTRLPSITRRTQATTVAL